MLINLNDRVPEYFDIYKVDINTGDRELLYKNTENYSHFIADDILKFVLVIRCCQAERARYIFLKMVILS